MYLPYFALKVILDLKYIIILLSYLFEFSAIVL